MMDRKVLILLIILTLGLFSQAAFGAVCPDTVALGSIASVGDAHMAAVDSAGNLYVTQNTLNKISVFSQGGRLLRSVSHSQPLGITVDSDGIYVTDSYRQLTIYDRAFNKIAVINTGIRLPNGIAVTADRIYITDPNYYKIDIYSKAGQYIKSFYGGDLFIPVGIVVEPSTGNLYVTNDVIPPGVKVFDSEGNFLREFISNGWDKTGVLGHPVDIILDSEGRLLVSDSLQMNVSVFDAATGSFICSFGASETMQMPMGTAMGSNGLLYIADKQASKVFIVGVDNYSRMDISPASLSFSGPECGGTLPAQSVRLLNDGRSVLNWTAASDSNWISVSPATGQLNPTTAVDIAISVNPSGLGSGRHQGAVVVTSSDGTEEKVTVLLEVTAPPVLSVSPSSFAFSVRGADLPPAETLNIELTGDPTGSQRWSLTSDSWLSVSPSSGPSNSLTMASVGLNLDGLSGGRYSGNITVSAECASGSPQVIPVSLDYIKGGTIKVITNIQEASYTISGPQSFSGSGTAFVADAVPEGTYTITFSPVKGFVAPAPQSLYVAGGSTVEFVGNYKDLRKRASIIASLGRGTTVTAEEVRIYSGAGEAQGSFVISGRAGLTGGTTTSAGDIDGDGRTEVLTANGREGSISAFHVDGTLLGSFVAFKGFGAEVASGDLNGDGIAEIIAGASSQAGNPAEVRVLGYSNGSFTDTGIDFRAFERRGGVMVASGDLDGDGRSEIVTAQGAALKIWKVDASGGAGAWKVLSAGGFNVGGEITSVATGDMDADGVQEILVALQPVRGIATIVSYRADGSVQGTFSVESSRGVVIAAGDTDYDGSAEVAVAELNNTRVPTRIRVYASGAIKAEFNAFADINGIRGIRVSMGEVAE